MKLFVDSASINAIEGLVPLGIVDGITTNPSLLAKEEGNPTEVLKMICQLVRGPVSAEVVATNTDGMVREGRQLAGIDEHIVVKVPFGRDGVQACATLASENIRVNVTLVFSPTQALLAAKVGATFVSPFVGRLDDIASPMGPTPAVITAPPLAVVQLSDFAARTNIVRHDAAVGIAVLDPSRQIIEHPIFIFIFASIEIGIGYHARGAQI